MKNKTKIKALGIAAIFLGGVLLTSCTANFCNNEDKAHMAYPYEQGVTLYVDKADYEELKTNENTAKLITSEEEKGIAGPAFVDDDGDMDIFSFGSGLDVYLYPGSVWLWAYLDIFGALPPDAAAVHTYVERALQIAGYACDRIEYPFQHRRSFFCENSGVTCVFIIHTICHSFPSRVQSALPVAL